MAVKRFEPHLFDLDYQGNIDAQGQLKYVWGKEALSQSIKLWIASLKGEVIRSPNRGGYIASWIGKPMKSVDVDDIEMTIQDGLYRDFRPYIQIQSLTITPNYEKRHWHIEMVVYSTDLRVQVTIDEKIKARV